MSALTKQLANLAADAKGAAALVSSLDDASGTAREALLPTCKSVINRLAFELSAVADSTSVSVQSHIDGALDMTDGIDYALGVTSDLLRLAFDECARQGDSTSSIDSAMRAIERFLDDVSKLNRSLQTDLRHLELLAQAQERSHG